MAQLYKFSSKDKITLKCRKWFWVFQSCGETIGKKIIMLFILWYCRFVSYVTKIFVIVKRFTNKVVLKFFCFDPRKKYYLFYWNSSFFSPRELWRDCNYSLQKEIYSNTQHEEKWRCQDNVENHCSFIFANIAHVWTMMAKSNWCHCIKFKSRKISPLLKLNKF